MTKIRGSRAAEIQGSVADLISEGYQEVAELAEEMRAWADSLEEHFPGTEKAEAVSASADTLEGLSEPDVPELANEVDPVTITIDTRANLSRSTRLSNALTKLTAGIEAAREWATEKRSELDEASEEFDGTDQPEAVDEGDLTELETWLDDLESEVSSLEDVEFPSAFG